jgi:hypothetical protein
LYHRAYTAAAVLAGGGLVSGAWYCHDGTEQTGPLDLDALTARLSACPNPAAVFVWRAGLEDWTRARDVAELATVLPPSPLPPRLATQLRAARDQQLGIPHHHAGDSRPAKWRWARIGALAGLSICLADLIFEWRGRQFAPWDGLGLWENIGFVFGTAFIAAVIGLIAGTARDRGRARKPIEVSDPPAPAASPSKGRHNNFIAKNWRGEYPLGVTYWVFGFLGNLAALAIPIAILGIVSADSGYQPKIIFASMAAIWLGALSIGVWQLVAVWRSANRRISERRRIGKYALWAFTAKVAVVLGFISLVSQLGISGLPQLTEASRMAFLNDPGISDYSIRIMRDSTEAEITGGF